MCVMHVGEVGHKLSSSPRLPWGARGTQGDAIVPELCFLDFKRCFGHPCHQFYFVCLWVCVRDCAVAVGSQLLGSGPWAGHRPLWASVCACK